jgi:hypothetical protein
VLTPRKPRFWVAAVAAAMMAGLAPAVAPGLAAGAAANQVLILGSTVSGGTSSLEAQEVTAQGYTPVVVDDSTWEGMTTAQFASYRGIVIGDPTCGSYDDTSNLAAALSNPGTWGAAVNGNVLIIGTDPVFHSGGTLTSGPGQLIAHGIDFTLAQAGKTGAYIDLSCAYGEVAANTPVTLLDGLRSGGFTVDGGPSSVCYDDAHIVATHPALAGLTDADLSGWGCSVHESFDTWPADYTVLAMARNFGSTYTASDGTVGEPYILASGSGLHSFPLSLAPVTQNAAAGSKVSVTAQLLDSSTSNPVPGQKISFRVETGPDAGVAGTCPASCTTDASGQAVWSFTGSKATGGAADTVQAWIDTNGDGKPSAGEPQTTAAVNWTAATTACGPVFYLGARGSGETGPGSSGGWVKSKDPSGFGPEVDAVYTQLQAAFGVSNVEPDPVRYAADKVPSFSGLRHGAASGYFRDLSAGVTQAHQDLVKQAGLCPDQEIVLGGYSQGAMVMHRVLHLLAGSAAGKQILSRVAATALIADGDQVSSDREVMDGSAWHAAYGVGQVDRGLSGSSAARFTGIPSPVIRVCDRGDLVCDFGTAAGTALARAVLGDLHYKDYLNGITIHTSYPGSRPLLQAARQVARDAQALNYYGGRLVLEGNPGSPVSGSAVVIGGKAPLTVFAGLDGTIPSWVALGASGTNTVTVSGTPPAAGSWAFTVEVQDAANNVVTIPVTLTAR